MADANERDAMVRAFTEKPDDLTVLESVKRSGLAWELNPYDGPAPFDRAAAEIRDLRLRIDLDRIGDHEATAVELVERRAEVAALCAERDRLKALVREMMVCVWELHAEVRGECPQIFNEDSGGNPHLDVQCEALVARARKEVGT